MTRFQKEIDDLRQKSQILPELFISKDDLKSLRKRTDQMKQFVRDITDTTQVNNKCIPYCITPLGTLFPIPVAHTLFLSNKLALWICVFKFH